MFPVQLQRKAIHDPAAEQGTGDVEIQHRMKTQLRRQADEQGVQWFSPLVQKQFGMLKSPASVEEMVPAVLSSFGPAAASVNEQKEQAAQGKPEQRGFVFA
jgi:predicted sugar kinase